MTRHLEKAILLRIKTASWAASDYYHRLLFLFIMMALFQAGCATIAGRYQIIGIDSIPRGLLVKDLASQRHLGMTPFFTKIARQPTLKLSYAQSGDDDVSQSFVSKCNYRVVASFMGNGLLAGISLPLGLTGYATDFLTGSAYDCPIDLTIHRNDSAKTYLQQNLSSSCQRALIVPPYYLGHTYAMQVRNEWIAKAPQLMKAHCVTYVPEREAFSILAKLKFGTESRPRISSLTARAHAYLGYHTRSDLLIILTPSHAFESKSITPVVVDLFSKEKMRISAYESEIIYHNELSFSDLGRFVEYTSSIFPNSIRLGPENGDLVAFPKNDTSTSRVYHRRSLPYFINLFDVATVSHSDRFSPWDLEFKAYLKFPLFYWDDRYTLRLSDRSTRQFNLTYMMAGVLPTGEVNVHTPMGALGLSAGFGAMGSYQSADDEANKAYLSLALRQTINYVAFLTDSIYFYADHSTISFKPPQSALLKFSPEVVYTSVGLGYYFSHIKLLLGY